MKKMVDDRNTVEGGLSNIHNRTDQRVQNTTECHVHLLRLVNEHNKRCPKRTGPYQKQTSDALVPEHDVYNYK